MAVHYSADDLRALADALDELTRKTQKAGVLSDGEITLEDQGHVIRLHWQGDDECAVAFQDGPEEMLRARGRYVVEFPDPN